MHSEEGVSSSFMVGILAKNNLVATVTMLCMYSTYVLLYALSNKSVFTFGFIILSSTHAVSGFYMVRKTSTCSLETLVLYA